MTTEDLKKLDTHLIAYANDIAKEHFLEAPREDWLSHTLIHAILENNEYDPEKIKKSMDEEMVDMNDKLLPHYRDLKQVLFTPYEDLPLFINVYFNAIAKWRLINSI